MRSMANAVPPASSRLDPVVFAYSDGADLAHHVTDTLSTARVTVIQGIPTPDTAWSADGVAQAFGLQKAGHVLVSKGRGSGSMPVPCRLDSFFSACDDARWAVEQFPVQDNHLPNFVEYAPCPADCA